MNAKPGVCKRAQDDLRNDSVPAPNHVSGLHLNSARLSAMNRTHRNLVGTEIRRRRLQLGWSQAKTARHLELAGLAISRSGLAKIECGMLWVGDFELLYFARVLGIRVQDLFPNIPSEELLSGVVTKLLGTARAHSKKRGDRCIHARLDQP
jgi:transcriptional regulator with XRE-family HTH domain